MSNILYDRTKRDKPFDDYQFQVSAGYSFEFEVDVDIGWQIVEESDIETQRLGVLVAYTASF